jgi:hypothetical protein
MATTAQETHNVLGTKIEQLTSMFATLQTINDEQQDLIYKIEIMVDIISLSTSAQLLPLSQPSVMLELPSPPPPIEAIAPTDPPPELSSM